MGVLARLFRADRYTSGGYNNHKEMVSHASAEAISVLFFFLHFGFCLYYAFTGITPMALVNLGSMAVYFCCLLLGRRGSWRFPCLLLSAEISLYCVISVYFTGWDTGTQGYLPVMVFPTFMLFHLRLPYRVLQMTLYTLSMAACYLLKLSHIPVFAGEPLSGMTIANMIICMSAALLTFGLATIANHITEQAYQMQIEGLTGEANRDALTGLWNRRYATTALEELFQSPEDQQTTFVAMLDIDFFKHINDNYGHDTGDMVLRQLSDIIRENLRKTDLIARWGGEEFLVLLRGTNHNGAQKALSNLKDKVESTLFLPDSYKLHITVTCGFCACHTDAAGYEEYLRNSDQALYHGKNNGRNLVVDYAAISATAFWPE